MEWYCLTCDDEFKADALFLADLQCEVEHVYTDTIREAERVLEQVRIHHEAFCVAVAKAAGRAAGIRARKTYGASLQALWRSIWKQIHSSGSKSTGG